MACHAAAPASARLSGVSDRFQHHPLPPALAPRLSRPRAASRVEIGPRWREAQQRLLESARWRCRPAHAAASACGWPRRIVGDEPAPTPGAAPAARRWILRQHGLRVEAAPAQRRCGPSSSAPVPPSRPAGRVGQIGDATDWRTDPRHSGAAPAARSGNLSASLRCLIDPGAGRGPRVGHAALEPHPAPVSIDVRARLCPAPASVPTAPAAPGRPDPGRPLRARRRSDTPARRMQRRHQPKPASAPHGTSPSAAWSSGRASSAAGPVSSGPRRSLTTQSGRRRPRPGPGATEAHDRSGASASTPPPAGITTPSCEEHAGRPAAPPPGRAGVTQVSAAITSSAASRLYYRLRRRQQPMPAAPP